MPRRENRVRISSSKVTRKRHRSEAFDLHDACIIELLQDEPGLSRYEESEFSTLELSPESHRAL